MFERKFSRRSLAALGLMAGAVALGMLPAQAHEAKCPVCKLDVVQDTATQDNEVALKFGRKRLEYRCVWCAVTDAKTIQGDLTILAPSETPGKPVTLTRKGEVWTATPATAVFLAKKVEHPQCAVTYRAFTSAAALEAYAKKHASVVDEAKPQTLEQLLALVK